MEHVNDASILRHIVQVRIPTFIGGQMSLKRIHLFSALCLELFSLLRGYDHTTTRQLSIVYHACTQSCIRVCYASRGYAHTTTRQLSTTHTTLAELCDHRTSLLFHNDVIFGTFFLLYLEIKSVIKEIKRSSKPD